MIAWWVQRELVDPESCRFQLAAIISFCRWPSVTSFPQRPQGTLWASAPLPLLGQFSCNVEHDPVDGIGCGFLLLLPPVCLLDDCLSPILVIIILRALELPLPVDVDELVGCPFVETLLPPPLLLLGPPKPKMFICRTSSRMICRMVRKNTFRSSFVLCRRVENNERIGNGSIQLKCFAYLLLNR